MNVSSAFTKWFREHRPDAELVKVEFDDPATAGFEVIDGIANHPELNGLFVVWDVPAMGVIAALRERGLVLPIMTTILGNAAAIELAGAGSSRASEHNSRMTKGPLRSSWRSRRSLVGSHRLGWRSPPSR